MVVERDVAAEPGAGEIKPIRQVLDEGAFVPPEVVALARWTAEYYASGVGDAIPMLLPPMARGGRADAHKMARVVAMTAAGSELVAMGFQPRVRGPEGIAIRDRR